MPARSFRLLPLLAGTVWALSGIAQTGFAQTGAAQTGLAQTGVAQTGVAQTGAAQTGVAQTAPLAPPPAPLSHVMFDRLQQDPARLARLIAPAPLPAFAPAVVPAGSPWQTLATQPPFNPGAMLLLTDGTVMVQDQGPSNGGSGNWWRLTPDDSGSYLAGTWSQLATMPAGYAPLYDASAVLPDGRVIVEGGEYNAGSLVWTNLGAIYDPVSNAWTSVAPPTGSEWSRIGDGPSTVLANGIFMMGASGYSGTTAQALLDAKTLTWTATGTGKADGNGEEGWSLLPSGAVLTIDTTDGAPPTNTETYDPVTGAWTSAGSTPASLILGGEIGPQILRPDGTVFAVGASSANAIYEAGSGLWRAGPAFPVIAGAQYDVADGPAAVLPSGEVLVMASPGIYQTPAHFFVFNGKTLTQVADTANAASLSSYDGFMLVLPTGQVLFNSRLGEMDLYTDTGAANPKWAPSVTSVPTTLAAGGSYKLSGKQLSGLTQGAAYGDDYQSATNYPLVRIVNAATGHVAYARSFGHTKVPVAGGKSSSTRFQLPATIETGAASLFVVANGIASAPVSVTITAAAVAAR